MQMHLFPGYTHVLLAVPFFPVIFAGPLESFRCLWTDIYSGKNGCWFCMEPFIYKQDEFIEDYLKMFVHKGTIGLAVCE